jgi:DNA processing protein
MENQERYIVTLHEIEGIGFVTMNKLMKAYPDLTVLFQLDAKQIQDKCQLDEDKVKRIKAKFTPQNVEYCHAQMAKVGVHYLTYWDHRYPAELRTIPEPPIILYYKGNVELLKLPLVAMVGTRNATHYGIKCATVLARSIAAHGISVVSGLARGIDGYCHRAALAQPGRTIAVMATGFDRIYPAEHVRLANTIAKDGLLLTESPLGQRIREGCFPRRNRIIAGLAMGTVVVEASHKSGSLITAGYAAEYNRAVCVVPGNIFSKESEGTAGLIRDGATLVATVDQVFEACGLLVGKVEGVAFDEGHSAYTEDEIFVLQLLTTEAMTVDEIFQHCKFSLGHLHVVLLSLQMRKAVKALPGSYFISLR